MIQINGTVTTGDTFTEDTIAAIVRMMQASRAEDGCIDYTFARDLADPAKLVVYERRRDHAALEAHRNSAHMAEFRKFLAANPPGTIELRLYETDEGEPLG